MRKMSLSRSAILLLLLSAGLSFIIIESCRKMDKQATPASNLQKEKFFRIHPGTDPLVNTIAQNIRRQDEKRNLVSKIVDKAGFPVWEKAVVNKITSQARVTQNEQQVFIPIVNEDDRETRAILAVKLNGEDTLFTMVYAAAYRQYGFDSTANNDNWSALDVFAAFTYFDHTIFDRTGYYLSDSRLLGTTEDTISNQPATIYIENIGTEAQGRLQRSNPGTIVIYITYVHCDYPSGQKTASFNSRVVGPNCYNATYVQHQVNFTLDENLPGGGYFESGGGGGPDSYMCIGCNWEDTNPCDTDPNLPMAPCDDDWQPIPNAVDEPFNPDLYDSVGVTDALEEAYPCVAALINDSLKDANWLAQIAGSEVFHDSAYMHLQFDTSTVNTTVSQHPATTIVGDTAGIDIAGNTHFTATITLNGWFLRNATRNAIINSIIHESMHAIFTMRWAQYQAWLHSGLGSIDSNYIKSHFPIHWSYIMQRPPGPNEEQQHIIMGTDYLDKFLTIGRPFYNPAASPALRDSVLTAMALHGLYKTSMWSLLPSMGRDTCKIKIMREISLQSLVGSFSLSGCGNFTTHYADSLKLTPNCN
jgi:hypothetical protein